MPIEFFSQDEETISLDFLPDALEDNPKLNGQMYDVFSFKKAKSGKGYMLYTSHFICWFFKKEKACTQMLEALDYYCKQGIGYQFVVQVDKKLKSKFALGIDSEREVKYIPLENMSYRLGSQNESEDTQTSVQKENPFLLKTPNPSLPPLNTALPNSGGMNLGTTHQGRKGRDGMK